MNASAIHYMLTWNCTDVGWNSQNTVSDDQGRHFVDEGGTIWSESALTHVKDETP